MTKTEKTDFETAQNNFRVACEANQKLVTDYNELVRKTNAQELENRNLKQQVLNVTLERTALFQSLWDLQKLRKEQDAEITTLKQQPQLQGIIVSFGNAVPANAGNDAGQ